MTCAPRHIPLQIDDALPSRDDVLALQGVPLGHAVSPAIARTFDAAIRLLADCATPRGLLLEVDQAAFESVYRGAGRNADRTPIGDIYPQAGALALFAVTLGPRVTTELNDCFKRGEVALAAMLDAAASCTADNLAEIVEQHFATLLRDRGDLPPGQRALRYSPGYCGWDISGQRRLFDALQPERIGIQLGDTFLMDPLKSVSGVIVVGPVEIHRFGMVYPACRVCTERGCRTRIQRLSSD
jgi:hypothetical protein